MRLQIDARRISIPAKIIPAFFKFNVQLFSFEAPSLSGFYRKITKAIAYLNKESIPGILGIPSLATAASSVSLTRVAFSIALLMVRTK